MRAVVIALMLFATPAAADDGARRYGIGASGTFLLDYYAARYASLELTARVVPALPSMWLEAAVGTGGASGWDAGDTSTDDPSLWEARAGAAFLPCSGSLCGGGRASLGYQRERHMESDGLVQDDPWEVRRYRVFTDLRAVFRIMIEKRVLLDVALGMRASFATVHRRAPDFERGFVGAAMAYFVF